MNFVRKTATTLGGIFFAVLLIAALAPKATQGVAAALVQVTNTASNAVPTEDGPGNFPFVAAGLCAEPEGKSECGNLQAGFSVPATTSTGAAVKRLVIEDLTASCSIDTGSVISTRIIVSLPADNVDALNRGITQYFFPVTTVGGGFGVAHSPARIYADPGTGIGASLVGSFAAGSGGSCLMYLSGHLETK
jgi:hypothetical protein